MSRDTTDEPVAGHPGFMCARSYILSALAVMGARCCSYSLGPSWAPFCDCKFGVDETWPTVHETGNGCPELRTLWHVVNAMNDDEWEAMVGRAGGVIRPVVSEATADG